MDNNTIIKTYHYRLCPTQEQLPVLHTYVNACRFVYNYGIGKIREALQANQKPPTPFDLIYHLKDLKKQPDTAWIKQGHSQALVSTMRDLNFAVRAYYREKKKGLLRQGFKGQGVKFGYPAFRAKGKSDSFRIHQDVTVEDSHLKVPKLGFVKFIEHRPLQGTLKTALVKFDGFNWYVSFIVEMARTMYEVSNNPTANITVDGIALQINGELIPEQHIDDKYDKRLRMLHKRLSRTQKDSKRRQRAKLRLAKVYRKVKRIRKDYLHKLSHSIENKYSTFNIVNVAIKESIVATKDSAQQKKIHDAGWGMFIEMLRYKAQWKNKEVTKEKK
jgi:putative transposase